MSSDSPIQTVLQQRDARPVSGEQLEVLGKHAASLYVQRKCASLHEAVVGTVREEHLSPAQVQRVVEFANQDAYLQEFRKEGAHHVVNFEGGPADPAQVLQDLNDGGGGSVYDSGMLDYLMTPSMAKRAAADRQEDPLCKTASAEVAAPGLPKLNRPPGLPKTAFSHYEPQLWELFTEGKTAADAFADPLRPLTEVRQKLAGTRDELAAVLDALELDYAEAGDRLYQQVKQASLEGSSLSDVVTAWSAVTTEPVYVKVAFGMLTPRLRDDFVYRSLDEIGASLQKRASAGVVNEQHPLVESYRDFVDTLNKLAAARALHAEYAEGADTAEMLLLKQAGGVLGVAKKGLSAASRGIDAAAKPAAHILVGAEDAKKLAPLLAGGVKLTALGAAGLAGNAAIQNVTDRPVPRRVLQHVKAITPGTAEYQNRRYQNMMGQ